VRGVVEAERQRLRDSEEEIDALDGLPDYYDHTEAVRKRLARLAEATDPPGVRESATVATDLLGV
jgi:hypothetical protein